MTLPLEKCPDKTATAKFSIKSQMISANIGSETASMMSDAISVDEGPQSEFNFGDEETKDSEVGLVSLGPNLEAKPRRKFQINQIAAKPKPDGLQVHLANDGRPPLVIGNLGGQNADAIINRVREQQQLKRQEARKELA